MLLLFTHSTPFSCYFLILSFKYSSENPLKVKYYMLISAQQKLYRVLSRFSLFYRVQKSTCNFLLF
jgi:hypothetical protein